MQTERELLQEMFDKTARALIAQGGPSVGEDGKCKYRGLNGRRCAAGVHIPDERYSEALEGKGVNAGDVLDALGSLSGSRASSFMVGLQWAHDSCASLGDEGWLVAWRTAMRRLARTHGLSEAALDEPLDTAVETV